jgi:hypothetical protein
MPESSPELRCRGACWLMRDAERQARRRPLRSLCTANRERFDAVGFHPGVAVVDEQRDRDDGFRCEGVPSIPACAYREASGAVPAGRQRSMRNCEVGRS